MIWSICLLSKKRRARQKLLCSKTVYASIQFYKISENCPTQLTIGDFERSVKNEDFLSGHAKLQQKIQLLKFEIPHIIPKPVINE
jgi:hypothetical protein